MAKKAVSQKLPSFKARSQPAQQIHICWHGTNAKAAKSILRNGFRPHTHFAAHMEDAISMGGPYLFAVIFYEVAPNWQFLNRNKIPPTRIKCLTQFWSDTLVGEPLFGRTQVQDDIV